MSFETIAIILGEGAGFIIVIWMLLKKISSSAQWTKSVEDDLKSINKWVDKHEQGCDTRYTEIMTTLGKLTDNITDLKSDVSVVKDRSERES